MARMGYSNSQCLIDLLRVFTNALGNLDTDYFSAETLLVTL
jgi:hypothetical protein